MNLESDSDPEPATRGANGGEFFRCHYCGCDTNARLRECCELGNLTDLKRLPPEPFLDWMVHAERWLPDSDGTHPGSAIEDAGGLISILAGRLLVTGDEVRRLRGCRDAVGELSQKVGKLERELVSVVREERAASERMGKLNRMLCEVCDAVESNTENTALRRELLVLLTGEKEPSALPSPMAEWVREAEQGVLHGEAGVKTQSLRVLALIEHVGELIREKAVRDAGSSRGVKGT